MHYLEFYREENRNVGMYCTYNIHRRWAGGLGLGLGLGLGWAGLDRAVTDLRVSMIFLGTLL